ncbi:hypothetical protein DL96DRAFT_1589664 [Flagelloscypha sp. PMI_526]|nr:hypothetical protein DL96DRAFT_1589664 [Flagelloscypha sp. PMI_526]
MREGIRDVEGRTNPPHYTACPNARTLDATQVSSSHALPQVNWTVNDDGWIVQTHTNNRIMWLPDTLTAYLYRPANTMIIAEYTASLDLAGAENGPRWMLCYTP